MTTVESTEALNTREARGCVYGSLSSGDPTAAVIEMVGDVRQVSDPNILKIAQYALLIPPAKRGLTQYLADPFEVPESESSVTHYDVDEGVGEKSAKYILKEIEKDPNFGLIQEINSRREDILADLDVSTFAIAGLERVIPMAAKSAASTTTGVAFLVAAELQSSGQVDGADRETFIEAVKLSDGLERGSTKLHLGQLSVTHWAISLLSEEIARGERATSPNANNLMTRKGIVRLPVTLQDWMVPHGMMKNQTGNLEGHDYHLNGSRDLKDVRLGCIFSFASELVVAYYRQHVDLLEKHSLWPVKLRST